MPFQLRSRRISLEARLKRSYTLNVIRRACTAFYLVVLDPLVVGQLRSLVFFHGRLNERPKRSPNQISSVSLKHNGYLAGSRGNLHKFAGIRMMLHV